MTTMAIHCAHSPHAAGPRHQCPAPAVSAALEEHRTQPQEHGQDTSTQIRTCGVCAAQRAHLHSRSDMSVTRVWCTPAVARRTCSTRAQRSQSDSAGILLRRALAKGTECRQERSAPRVNHQGQARTACPLGVFRGSRGRPGVPLRPPFGLLP